MSYIDIQSLSADSASLFLERLKKAALIRTGWFSSKTPLNGVDQKITVLEVWRKYKKMHLPTISESSRVLKIYRSERFLRPLTGIRMCELNPQVLAEFLFFCKETYVQASTSKKYNFDKEMRDFKSVLNWHRDTVDFQFSNPVRPMHFRLAVMEEMPEKNRKITVEQLQAFLSALPEFYRDLATIQFFCGARIGEIAGLQVKNVDLERRVLTIKEVMVWIRGKPKIKICPKNGLSREIHINDTMLKILKRHLSDTPIGFPFVFHRKGLPLRYNALDANYNKAWKRAGLAQFSGTHLMRYAAAQTSRRITGSIDGAKAVTGHQSIQLAEKYSDFGSLEANRSSVEKLEEALEGTG